MQTKIIPNVIPLDLGRKGSTYLKVVSLLGAENKWARGSERFLGPLISVPRYEITMESKVLTLVAPPGGN